MVPTVHFGSIFPCGPMCTACGGRKREGGGGIRGVDDWWVMQSDTFRGGARFTVSVSTHGTR